MREQLDNDYSYAIMVKQWGDSKGRLWFSGYAIQANEKGNDRGVYSYSNKLVTVFGPRLKSDRYDIWFKNEYGLGAGVYVDRTVGTTKTKREVTEWFERADNALKRKVWEQGE